MAPPARPASCPIGRPARLGRPIDVPARNRFALAPADRRGFRRERDLGPLLVARPRGRAAARRGPTRARSRPRLKQLAGLPPLVFAGEARNLTAALAQVADGRGLPAPGRRLRRVLRRVLRRRHPRPAQGHPPDGGRADLLLGRPDREGRAASPASSPSPARPTPRRSTASSSRRSAATSSTTSLPTDAARVPEPRAAAAGVPPVGVDAEPAAGLHEGRLRRPVAACTSGTRSSSARAARASATSALADEIDRALRFMQACGIDSETQPEPARGRLLHEPRGADPRLRGGAHPRRTRSPATGTTARPTCSGSASAPGSSTAPTSSSSAASATRSAASSAPPPRPTRSSPSARRSTPTASPAASR